MGVIIRILFFVIGAIGLFFTGVSGAEDMGVDANSMLASLGDQPGDVALSMSGAFESGLDHLGALLANVSGGEADAKDPGAVQKFGPEAIAGIVSALMMMISARR